jgi:hypothetical protein
MRITFPATGGRPGGSRSAMPWPVLLLAVIAVAACAPQGAVDHGDEDRSGPPPRVRPQTAPEVDPAAVKPLAPVVIDPPAPPQPHPLAPESLPDKPQTIPEDVPGTKPPR